MNTFLHSLRKKRAFTLLELMITISVFTIVGGVAYSVLTSGMTLYTKNLSLNLSATAMRSAVDQVLLDIQNSKTMPDLINTSGQSVTSGWAQGIRYDAFVGAPYVLLASQNANSLPATTKQIKITRDTGSILQTPVPEVGDVLIINGYPETARLVITSVSATTPAPKNAQDTITVKFSNATGIVMDLKSTTVIAHIIRQSAMMAVPTGNGLELRYYRHSEGLNAAGFANKSNYRVISTTVNSANGGDKPFQLQKADGTPAASGAADGDTYLAVNLSIREERSTNHFTKNQKKGVNDYLYIKTLTHPKTAL